MLITAMKMRIMKRMMNKTIPNPSQRKGLSPLIFQGSDLSLSFGEALLAHHLHKRNQHFFHAYAAMLKSVAVIIHVIIVIIRIT